LGGQLRAEKQAATWQRSCTHPATACSEGDPTIHNASAAFWQQPALAAQRRQTPPVAAPAGAARPSMPSDSSPCLQTQSRPRPRLQCSARSCGWPAQDQTDRRRELDGGKRLPAGNGRRAVIARQQTQRWRGARQGCRAAETRPSHGTRSMHNHLKAQRGWALN
jgi:hypothetical protein